MVYDGPMNFLQLIWDLVEDGIKVALFMSGVFVFLVAVLYGFSFVTGFEGGSYVANMLVFWARGGFAS